MGITHIFRRSLPEDIRGVALGCKHKECNTNLCNKQRKRAGERNQNKALSPLHSWPMSAWGRCECGIIGFITLQKSATTDSHIQFRKGVFCVCVCVCACVARIVVWLKGLCGGAVVWSVIWLLDGLQWNLVQSFMVPRGWSQQTLVIPWLLF